MRSLYRAWDLLTMRWSGLFNAQWYLFCYPDVRSYPQGPAAHYLNHGAAEGRDPSWAFSTSLYRSRYPDVRESGMNPLLHFIRIGSKEGRDGAPEAGIRVDFPPAGGARHDLRAMFRRDVRQSQPRTVIEVGTRRVRADVPTHSRSSFPWVSENDYLKVDLFAGEDVDVVADLHSLPAEWSGRFECFIADAVFEHLERPWLAAREVARVLAPGGLFWIGSHQCFPLHGHPQDFFRFSRDALRLLFEDAGLEVDCADYGERCLIVPSTTVVAPHSSPDWRALDSFNAVNDWNMSYPSYVRVFVSGRKRA